MTTYTVTATREGKWWVVDCGEHGVTQARSLHDARDNEAARQSRAAVDALVRQLGLSGRDAAAVLGVSPQRVSQLLVDSSTGRTARPRRREPKSASAAG